MAAFLTVMLVVPWALVWDADRLGDGAGSAGGADPAGAGAGRSLFASARERRLWLWALAVVVAIFVTLSPAQQAAAGLRERGLLGPFTSLFLLAVGGVVALRWAKAHPGTLEIGAALGVAAVYITTVVRLPIPEARSHLFEYGVVAMLIHQALLERRRSGRAVWVPAALAVGVTTLLGWLDELIQIALPTRVFDWRDVGFNALAASLAVSASVFVAWARRLDRRRRESERPGGF